MLQAKGLKKMSPGDVREELDENMIQLISELSKSHVTFKAQLRMHPEEVLTQGAVVGFARVLLRRMGLEKAAEDDAINRLQRLLKRFTLSAYS
jgi:hypothetical protein